MINLTSQYPSQTFLPVAATQIINQVNSINSSRIINRNFPKKFGRLSGAAPDNSGAVTTQIDVLINGDATYGLPRLNDAQSYAFQAAGQVVTNPSFYVENVQPSFYQIVVWGLP